METAKQVLSAMKVGYVTVRWDCILYRVSTDRWMVGRENLKIRRPDETFDLDSAAAEILSLCRN